MKTAAPVFGGPLVWVGSIIMGSSLLTCLEVIRSACEETVAAWPKGGLEQFVFLFFLGGFGHGEAKGPRGSSYGSERSSWSSWGKFSKSLKRRKVSKGTFGGFEF